MQTKKIYVTREDLGNTIVYNDKTKIIEYDGSDEDRKDVMNSPISANEKSALSEINRIMHSAKINLNVGGKLFTNLFELDITKIPIFKDIKFFPSAKIGNDVYYFVDADPKYFSEIIDTFDDADFKRDDQRKQFYNEIIRYELVKDKPYPAKIVAINSVQVNNTIVTIDCKGTIFQTYYQTIAHSKYLTSRLNKDNVVVIDFIDAGEFRYILYLLRHGSLSILNNNIYKYISKLGIPHILPEEREMSPQQHDISLIQMKNQHDISLPPMKNQVDESVLLPINNGNVISSQAVSERTDKIISLEDFFTDVKPLAPLKILHKYDDVYNDTTLLGAILSHTTKSLPVAFINRPLKPTIMLYKDGVGLSFNLRNTQWISGITDIVLILDLPQQVSIYDLIHSIKIETNNGLHFIPEQYLSFVHKYYEKRSDIPISYESCYVGQTKMFYRHMIPLNTAFLNNYLTGKIEFNLKNHI